MAEENEKSPEEILEEINGMTDEERAVFISEKLEDTKSRLTIDALGKFIVAGLHDKPEDVIASTLLSVIVNLGINKEMCPICFSQHLSAGIKQMFKEIPLKDGEHDYEFVEAKLISDLERGDAPKH